MRDVIRINRNNAEYQIIESLATNRSKRSKLKQGFIEGIESLKQASSAGYTFTRVIYPSGREISDWAKQFLSSAKIEKIIELDSQLYNSICERSEPSEMVATFAYPNRVLSQDIIRSDSIFLLCDRPSDKGNFGSIIRTANNFGIAAVLKIGHGVETYDPKVIRSSLGSVFHTPVYEIESMEHFSAWMDILRSDHQGILIGSDSSGTEDISATGIHTPLVLVTGNEAKGMSKSILEMCDITVRIPGVGNVNSMNVACAGSILMWEMFKQTRG